MHGVNMNGFELTEQKINQLVELALRARERAYVPYSHFRVGACLMSKNGTLYCGCNIENAGYTPTNCAERTAIFKAVYEGERQFSAIALLRTAKILRPRAGYAGRCLRSSVMRKCLLFA